MPGVTLVLHPIHLRMGKSAMGMQLNRLQGTEERPPVEPRVDSGNGSGDPVMPSSSDPPADLVMETPTETKPESSVLSKSSNPICS